MVIHNRQHLLFVIFAFKFNKLKKATVTELNYHPIKITRQFNFRPFQPYSSDKEMRRKINNKLTKFIAQTRYDNIHNFKLNKN